MSFTTKKYTRPVLIAELRRVNARYYTDYTSFVNAFSPRAGRRSAKLAALKEIIPSMQLNMVFHYNSGANAKGRLIELLKNS